MRREFRLPFRVFTQLNFTVNFTLPIGFTRRKDPNQG